MAKRSLPKMVGAFGRAHRKASQQLESSMPLLQHLEELRQRIFKTFGAVMLTTLLSFVFADKLIDLFAAPLGGKKAMVSIEVVENMAIFMRVSLLSGFVMAVPVIVYQIMAFMLPGLNRRERVWILVGVPLATLLFVSGVVFTWFVLIPAAIPFLINFLGIPTQVRPTDYFSFITRLMFWIGIFFEMPLLSFFLAKMKVISAKQLIAGWRYAVVAIAVAAAGITPTIDPINMGLVMLPLSVLYIFSILLAAIARKD